jgi:hypothetical protein
VVRVIALLLAPVAIATSWYIVAWFRLRWGLAAMRRKVRIEEQRLDATRSWVNALIPIGNEVDGELRQILVADGEAVPFLTTSQRAAIEAVVAETERYRPPGINEENP